MKYKVEDINFTDVTPREFENLCYDLIVNYNFQDLIWREGGADNGRDIEANFTFNNSIGNFKEKWFFECKHYANGVPPTDLQSKIAWSDSESPKYLVFFISSYLTNATRGWLEKIQAQKTYTILVIEGEDLKNRIVKYPDIVERYFSQNKHENLFRSIKDFKIKFNLNPSYEVLKEIIVNIKHEKLDTDDFGFLILHFYENFMHRYYDNDEVFLYSFDLNIIDPLLEYLISNIENDVLATFGRYKADHDYLSGVGFVDEMNKLYDEDGDRRINFFKFQYSKLHLNSKMDTEFWKIGTYVFVIYKDFAIEIFEAEEMEIRIIKNFDPSKILSMSAYGSYFNSDDYDLYLEVAERNDGEIKMPIF